jgi:hypothetical protein
MSFTKFAQSLLLIFVGMAAVLAARPAYAQTEILLHNFTGYSDGGYPNSRLIPDGKGNFYGTTGEGGFGANPGPTPGAGTVFELSPLGHGVWNETVLYSFCEPYQLNIDCTDGDGPAGPVIFDSAGNLYGTTCAGGAYGHADGPGYGVVFELSPAGASWTETVLYNFATGAESCPANNLIMDADGNLYGSDNAGIFELSPSSGTWTEQLIYAYGGRAGLTMDAAGNIFANGTFSVFELSPNGSGGWNQTFIHTFTNAVSVGTLALDQAGNIYGTRTRAGANGYGAVYRLSPGERGQWTKTILYSFRAGNDGAYPIGGVVLDAAGNIYGTTAGSFGGRLHKGQLEYGNVFELVAPVDSGSYQDKVLWTFNGNNGDFPYGDLILGRAGHLFGLGFEGGSGGYGVAYEVIP